jgi:tRNA (cmo5U34)-methyltransferase
MKKKILAKNSSWSFEKNVPKKFSYHIKQSVPFYEEGHNIICNISDFFLKKNSYVYDIGSSTGTLLNKLANRHNNKKINFYGIETVKEMIIQSKVENKNNKIKYINKDIKKIFLKKSDLIISYYTIQFIDPKYRQQVLDKIYKTLNWGGAFLMFEKIRASDARFQDIYTQIYNDFKLNQDFTEKEIINKSRSLKGILEPFSDYGNMGLLKRSGFSDIIPVFQWFCFKGYLAIK